VLIPRLRRTVHLPGDFLADAILVPVGSDVNINLVKFIDDGVTSDINARAASMGGATVLSQPTVGAVSAAGALDDEDEDEDDDDDYDDLDEEDDEDLDDEDDEGYDDDLDDDDDDLDDGDLDDEDDEDDE
jgi:hypothetical protein